MTFLVKDGVLESATGSGTGNLTLGGAVSDYQSFATAGYVNGDTFPAYIKGISGSGEWQTAILTYNTGGTVSRTTPLDGSSGVGVAVNFTAGAKQVGVVAVATMVGWQQIGATQSPSGVTSVSFTSIAAIYSDLLVNIIGLSHSGAGSPTLRIELSADGVTWTTIANVSGTAASTAALYGDLFIPNYREGSGSVTGGTGDLVTNTAAQSGNATQSYRLSGPVQAIRFSWSGGENFDGGSVKLKARL